MGRKAKKVYKEGPFQKRLRILFDEHCKSQDDLANKLVVSRQTVGGWLNGISIPDIEVLTEMAQLFGVSADYLLGLSDAESPDVSVRAASEYTGLSEDAVQRLHLGLDDFGCGLSDEEKATHLATASELIQSKAFAKMIAKLVPIEELAYANRILDILKKQHLGLNRTEEDTPVNRDIVVPNLIHLCEDEESLDGESIPDAINAMSDDKIRSFVLSGANDLTEDFELHQFHASKAFTNYVDHLIVKARRKADQRFTQK